METPGWFGRGNAGMPGPLLKARSCASSFEAQTLTYLRLLDLKLGLVINFGRRLATSTNKPERLTIPNFSSGAFTLVIWNEGQFPDEGTYEIGLTQ